MTPTYIRNKWKFWRTLSVFLVFFFLFALISPVFSSENVAAERSIREAESVVASAYRVVSEAEKAGANVTILLSRLNEATEYLSKANISYKRGDFENASYFANLCVDVTEDVEVEAVGLRDEALGYSGMYLLKALTLSGIGVFSVVFAGFMGWPLFKKLYLKRLLKLKPEVGSDEPQ